MKQMMTAILLSVFLGYAALAQSLIPATSEDLNDFDKQISAAREKEQKNKAKKANFGATVSEEAKKLENSEAEQKNKFGKWVSGQKAKDNQNASANANKDAKVSSPANNDHGNSANAPGRSGKNNGRTK